MSGREIMRLNFNPPKIKQINKQIDKVSSSLVMAAFSQHYLRKHVKFFYHYYFFIYILCMSLHVTGMPGTYEGREMGTWSFGTNVTVINCHEDSGNQTQGTTSALNY